MGLTIIEEDVVVELTTPPEVEVVNIVVPAETTLSIVEEANDPIVVEVVAGIAGPSGPPGADGADGADGAAGPTGPAGATGPAGITVVHHGTNGATARPSSPVVYWIGTSTPANSLAYDFWLKEDI